MTKTVSSILFLLIIASLSFVAGYSYKNQELIKGYGDKVLRAIKDSKTAQVVIKGPPINVKTVRPAASQPIQSNNVTKNWTGPQFWDEISNKRREIGLSPIPSNETLCTLAAIRLAELRRLERLDDHNGFKPLIDKYKEDLQQADLLSLFEFLTSGAPTAKEAVAGLFNTMGHRALFTEVYKGGCAYAADTFGVVITSK
jgi:uncharacterized protein YkwD